MVGEKLPLLREHRWELLCGENQQAGHPRPRREVIPSAAKGPVHCPTVLWGKKERGVGVREDPLLVPKLLPSGRESG